MIVVKVTYTVKQAFAVKNQENIHRFMSDFKALDNEAFRYTAYVGADGKTFVHHSMYKNEAIQQQLLNVDSFKSFQAERDASGLEGIPDIQVLKVVDSSDAFLQA
jgi:hypothetical protein